MQRKKNRSLSRFTTTTALLLGGALAGPARGADAVVPEPSEKSRREHLLEQQLQALQARVNVLEAQRHPAQGAAAATSAAAAADVAQVLDDAERRSNPLYGAAGGVTAGYDKKFFIKSDDGNFLLKPQLQFQFRHVSNYEQDARHQGEEDSFESGFEARRTRFRFDGNAFTPKLTYSFVWDTSRTNGAVSLLDAWVQYGFAEKWAVRVGQFKESVFHERDVSGFSQLAVERSLVDALLGGNITDRVQGVSLIYGGGKDDNVRAEVAIHDGANSRNTNFQDGATHWGAGGRFEYKVFGDWANYRDFTAKNNKEDLLVVGAGAEYTDRDGADVLLPTADVQYELADRLIVYGAVHGAYTDPHSGTDDPTRFDFGVLGQVGYLLNKKWEVFGRYDVVALDDEAIDEGNEDTFHEITTGVNYYLGPDGSYLHKAKFSLDVTYLPNGAPSDQTQAGILAGEGDEIVLRAQFQLQL